MKKFQTCNNAERCIEGAKERTENFRRMFAKKKDEKYEVMSGGRREKARWK